MVFWSFCFLAPTGAQGVTLSVCPSVTSSLITFILLFAFGFANKVWGCSLSQRS